MVIEEGGGGGGEGVEGSESVGDFLDHLGVKSIVENLS